MKQSLDDIEVILLDIEGTVCPISFVKDTLFPYALQALPKILETKWDSPDFQAYKSGFPSQYQTSPSAMQAHVEDLTERDIKIAYLKNLQGYLWEEGYKSHVYSTPLYDDVYGLFAQKIKIAIYSSGSIFAQKLLFAHCQPENDNDNDNNNNHNKVIDLNPRIEVYYDTTNAGPKQDAQSYRFILKDLENLGFVSGGSGGDTAAKKVLFLSDNVNEINAARQVGLTAVVVDRPGNAPLTEHDRNHFDVVTSFEQLQLNPTQ